MTKTVRHKPNFAAGAQLYGVEISDPLMVNALSNINKLGNLTVVGHSYVAGTSQADVGCSNVYQESLVAKLQALLGIHDDNVRHFGQGSSKLSTMYPIGNATSPSGWVGALQFLLPNNAANVNSVGDKLLMDILVGQGGALMIVHGLNDINCNIVSFATQGVNAWKHALRTVISRWRAGVVLCSTCPAGTISWDPSISFSGTWSDVASTIQNTGPAYKATSTNTDYAEVTLPDNFAGGVVSVALIAQANGRTTLNGAIDNSQTTMIVASAAEFNTARFGTTYVAHIAAEGGNAAEDVLVTGGIGTTTWTITRGVNGTSAVAHGSGAVVSIANTALATWSTDGSNGNISGTTSISAQGYFGSHVVVTKRFVCTSADAGKKIRATISGIVTGDTSFKAKFDSWWIEAPEPPLCGIANMHMWNYIALFNTWALSQTNVNALNAATDDIVAEFDEFVKVVDVYTPIWRQSGVITGSMNDTDATTVIGWTANHDSFTPTVGMRMSFGYAGTGLNVEHADITAVSGTAPNWTLTLKRAANTGTGKYTHASGDFLAPSVWMATDEIHLSLYGHSLVAGLFHQAFSEMIPLSNLHIAKQQGNWSQSSQKPTMGIVDGNWLSPPLSGFASVTPAQNKEGAVPIYIPKECVIVGVGAVASASSSLTLRWAIYFPDFTHSRPGKLLCDFGSKAFTSTTIATKTGVYCILRPGWYWIGIVQQATAVAMRTFAASAMGYPQLSQASIPSTAATTIGYSRTGQSSGATDWNASPTEEITTPNLIVPYLQLQAINFA